MEMTVTEFARAWDDFVGGRSEETRVHNGQMLRPFVKIHGDRQLRAVDGRWAREFAESNPSSVRYARTFFEDALRAGLVDANPFEGVRVLASRGRRDVTALTAEQVWRLADAVPVVFRGEPVFCVRFRALILTCAFSGIREIQAAHLEQAHVGTSQQPWELAVRRVKHSKQEWAILPEPRAQEALGDALAFAKGGLVFRSQLDRPLNRWSIQRAFARVRDHCEMPDVDFHELRHFFATWLIDEGVAPQDVAMALHGSMEIKSSSTVWIYEHASRRGSFERIGQAVA